MATKLGVLEKEWSDYRLLVMPKEVSDVQARETRNAFYAGAGCLFFAIMNVLDEGEEPTDKDLAVMDSIHKEIEGFLEQRKYDATITSFANRSRRRAMD